MRIFLALAAALLLFQAGLPPQAATPGEPAYRKVVFKANYPWYEGLSIVFEPDEAKCRKAYGSGWRVKCAASLGRPGDSARGVRLEPQARGHWQWREPDRLVFIPEDRLSIKPDTAYSADVSGLGQPSFIKLDRLKLSVKTAPISARQLGLAFWTDPSPEARHRLAASFEFNYPVPDTEGLVELAVPDGARFGKAEAVWSQDRDRLNISWPVRQLPASPARAGILLKGMGQIFFVNGEARCRPLAKGDKGAVFSQNMPGQDGLFFIKKIELNESVDENLDHGYELAIETSLYARPGDVLNNLELWELPEFNSPEAARPCNWIAAPNVPPDVLKKSRRLKPEPSRADNAARSKFYFRVPVESGRYLFAGLGCGLKSASGQKLSRPWFGVAHAARRQAALGFLQPGNILPMSKNCALDLYANDLDCIAWEVRLVREPFLALVAQGSDDAFNGPLERSGIGMDQVGLSVSGRIPLSQNGSGKAQFAVLELGQALKELSLKNGSREAAASGLAMVRLTGIKDGREKAWARRMVLATDLGLLVKRGAMGGYDCFASSLGGGMPAKGAMVSILGANGRPVASAVADASGHVSFPSLSGLKREALPVAAVAELGGQLAWLPLRDRSRELNYSDFSTGGLASSGNGVNAFVFSQRGIYRPGDALFFGCLVRRADFSLLPADLPLSAELRDPAGRKIWERKFRSGERGIAELRWDSPKEAASGRYTLNVLTGAKGENIGSTTVRLEEFQPDTLKLHIGVPALKGWLPVEAGPGRGEWNISLFMRNLYGAPASGRKIRAQVETRPAVFRFAGFEDYIFTDSEPLSGQGIKRKLREQATDEDGKAEFAIPGDLLGASSARITVSAEGFEAGGGRATVAQAAFMASPMRRILGYRPLGALTNMRFIGRNEHAELEFIALDPDLNHVAWEKVKFSVAQRRYVTSLVSDGNGGFRYDETPVDMLLKVWDADILPAGLKVALDTSQAGEFALTARDGEGRLLAQACYAVAGERIEPPDSPLACGKMRIRLDKSDYQAGDAIRVALSLPYDGSGLISIERDGVAAFTWFRASAGDSVQEIRIPENFEGKGYVVASFVRSQESPGIYISPHAFAVAPFSANIKKRDMGLRIGALQKVSPGSILRVKLSAREAGEAMLFAVDEGVLQLTGHHSPKPLDALLADRALEVRTLQAFDLLMPDHARLAPRLSAFGGGMDGVPFGARFQNPFKRQNEPPVAFWSGLVPVGPEEVEVKIPIPDYYNGELRIMAVGSTSNGAGSAVASSASAAPIILTPRLPLAVCPGDVFEGSLAVANTTGADATVELAMEHGKAFSLLQSLPGEVAVAANSEIVLRFRARALDEPEAAALVFHARHGSDSCRRTSFISVRPAGPLRTTLMGGVADKSIQIPVSRRVYAQNARSAAALSPLPLPLARGFLQYLDVYPYGCAEQLVSKSFARVLLRAWPRLAAADESWEKLATVTLEALRSRFNGQGISLWPNSEPDLALTVYAADFLLALREAGMGGGDDLLAMLCDAIETGCALNEPTLAAARTSAYAIWVLTREGRITTQLIENLLESLRGMGTPGWREDLTAALIAASQREMRIKKSLDFGGIKYSPDGWFDEFAQYALHMAILARYFPKRCGKKEKSAFFEACALAMRENRFATFSANQGIRALMALAGNAAPDIAQARLYCADWGDAANSELLADGAVLQYEVPQCSRYSLEIPGDSQPLFWQIATTGYDRSESGPAAMGIEVRRQYLDLAGKPADGIKLGDEVIVRITARAMSAAIKDCVISDLLPGCFEMVIQRGHGETIPPGIKYMDRQEDRMLLFADLTNMPMTFEYRARAVARGRFTVPLVAAEAMYSQACYGAGSGGEIEIR